MTRISLIASAKLNLNLKVLRRRPDGFHDIETVVQTVSLHDTLDLEEQRMGLALELDDPEVPSGPSNLVWRAAEELLMAAESRRRGVRIRLTKRIPAGAGLGGGSSDAAAALVGLNRLWGLGLRSQKLRALGAKLGADVPYFLVGGAARLTGIGTEIEPLPDIERAELLVIFPGTPVSTREVYGRLDAPLTLPVEIGSISRFERRPAGSWLDLVKSGNDLEASASALCPVIREVRDRLGSAGALVTAMTGSGSAVFGVFAGEEASSRAAREISQPGWRVMRCAPLSRVEYRRLLGLD
jgi:4-diphosphocytidyl-2-C-methyl-D-erythritol kinase